MKRVSLITHASRCGPLKFRKVIALSLGEFFASLLTVSLLMEATMNRRTLKPSILLLLALASSATSCSRHDGQIPIVTNSPELKRDDGPISEASASPSDAPAWFIVRFRDFTFSLPKTLKKQNVVGHDTFVSCYANQHLGFCSEYGINVAEKPPHVGHRDLTHRQVTVSGRPATISVYTVVGGSDGQNFIVRLFVQNPVGSERNLSLEVKCVQETSCLSQAERIFETLSFPTKTISGEGGAFR